MVILTVEEILALRDLSLQPALLDSVVLERILGRLRVTVWSVEGKYKVYEV
jgi:hypothetical protein